MNLRKKSKSFVKESKKINEKEGILMVPKCSFSRFMDLLMRKNGIFFTYLIVRHMENTRYSESISIFYNIIISTLNVNQIIVARNSEIGKLHFDTFFNGNKKKYYIVQLLIVSHKVSFSR